MNIFNHLLPDDAVLGIGPLMLEYDPYSTDYMLYGKIRLVFDLHLPAHSTTIKSDWFYPKENPQEKEKKNAWHDHYWAVRKKIAAIMNEDFELHELTKKDLAN